MKKFFIFVIILLLGAILTIGLVKRSKAKGSEPAPVRTALQTDELPSVDRMVQLFTTGTSKLPIVETITYHSKVDWLGRYAWIADYASHYKTSRHFIARSLHGRPTYEAQDVREGTQFNVFKADRSIEFHLVVSLANRQMGLYYWDRGTDERVLLKTYHIGVGKRENGVSQTPIGTYSLGSRIAVHKPSAQTQEIRQFGSRWIPIDSPTKGIGIHGCPWKERSVGGVLEEDASGIGAESTMGGITLRQDELEELFSVVITRPTQVHIVERLSEAVLPGTEVATPK